MTPRQAARQIGCSPQQVRTLIRKGVIDAETTEYSYDITPAEVRRFMKLPRDGRGWKRGKTLSHH